jgi:5-methyltetrahydropteroyltriglutamate--homocysteine methyltransferase
MKRTKPPFRADMVGSLLRPERLHDARVKHEEGKISDGDLRKVEDEEIRKIIAKQEEIGLKAVTDGEFRRSWWHFDFLRELDGIEMVYGKERIQFHGVQTKAQSLEVQGKIGYSTHPMVEHFRFLKENTKAVPKMTIPSPSVLHFRMGYNAIKPVYPDLDEFFADVGDAYKAAIKDLYDAGCRYLQLDDTVWSYLCDPEQLDGARSRGDDPEKLPRRYADTFNRAIADRPDDMTITMHVCRGNFRSTWIASGGYEPIAEIMLGDLHIDGYFLEYDTDRAGGFEPLRFLPKGDKQVVLGLITSKTGALEDRDMVKKRIDEATKYAPIEQLCLSPQCGFASTEEGNLLSESEQWEKLRFIVSVADEVWG